LFLCVWLREWSGRGYKVKILCTDGYEGYGYYTIAQQHIVSKSETCLVESKNAVIRHYLARFNRRTKRFSKAFDSIKNDDNDTPFDVSRNRGDNNLLPYSQKTEL